MSYVGKPASESEEDKWGVKRVLVSIEVMPTVQLSLLGSLTITQIQGIHVRLNFQLAYRRLCDTINSSFIQCISPRQSWTFIVKPENHDKAESERGAS